MILSVPFAAFLARLAADNYDMRVLIYALTLLWCIIGVFTVLRVSKHVDIEPKLSISRVLRYVLMLWLWPALWLFTF